MKAYFILGCQTLPFGGGKDRLVRPFVFTSSSPLLRFASLLKLCLDFPLSLLESALVTRFFLLTIAFPPEASMLSWSTPHYDLLAFPP